MIKMSEINSLDKLKALFPNKNLEKCSVGLPVKDGISLGYEGWGVPDIILDPALPLDMCVDRLGFKSAFENVTSIGLLNCVHGDCFLTHTANGLQKLLKEGGKLSIEALNTSALAKSALESLTNSNITQCQMLEKFVFQPALDTSGLVFQQTFIDPSRLKRLFTLKLISEHSEILAFPLCPDNVRLDSISDEKWEKAEKTVCVESLDQDRPSCLICNRLSTKMDSNRSVYSRYCKDHYHKARMACDQAIRKAYTIQLQYQK